ncbi:MAG: gliding motility-associated ABC transporter ATP-binding subunit GldA [Lutimonas sp.]
MSIEVQQLTKAYGSEKALKEVSFSIGAGEVVGFLGPNGAGKSTLMRILTTYLSPDQGHARVNGHDIEKEPMRVKRSVGYLPENNPLYSDLYVKEYLGFQCGIHKIGTQRIDDVVQLVGLQDHASKKISQLSKGYKQRVGLAAALIHDPEVLILDEPTTGLDPNQLADIRELIKEIGKTKTVLLSTHIMQEVEAMCDRVLIINRGTLVTDKKLKELVTEGEQHIEVEFDLAIEEQLLRRLPHLEKAENIYDTTWSLVFKTEKDMRPELFDFANNNGLKALKINKKMQNLESMFREMTRNIQD